MCVVARVQNIILHGRGVCWLRMCTIESDLHLNVSL